MSQEANERNEHRIPTSSNHSRPPRHHHRRLLLPRPGAGEQAQGPQMRESTQEGVGGKSLNELNGLRSNDMN